MAAESDDAADNIEKLYKNFGILADAKDNISEHEKEYLEIISAVKGTPKEKLLASQFIPRFFKSFPNLADQAIEAQLDLCEDDDVSIRKQAIKHLPTICKDNKEQVPRIADILAQLLQAEDNNELLAVQESLIALLKYDAKGTLNGIYSQLLTGDETVRERCIKFLSKNLVPIDHNVIDRAAEDFLILETKKVLQVSQDVTGDEFIQLLHILSNSRLAKSIIGQKELVDLIADQAEIDQPFNPEDPSVIDRIIHCTYCALPYFNFIDSSKFTLFFINEVVSQLDKIPVKMENFKFVHLELLKVYAECCAKCKSLPNGEEVLEKTINLLYRYIPAPPVDENTDTDFEFNSIEAAMYALHQLVRVCPNTLKVDSDLFKTLKLRLHYLACHVQGYVKPLRENIRNKSNKGENGNRVEILALKTATNISTMIKDFFHNPPRCKAEIPLSWKVPATLENKASGEPAKREKRSASSTLSQDDGQSASKQSKSGGREIYQPPSGKFSTKVSGYGPSKGSSWNGSRSGGRGSRNFRGGSRWRY